MAVLRLVRQDHTGVHEGGTPRMNTAMSARILLLLPISAAILSCSPPVNVGSEPAPWTPAQQQPAQPRVWPVITRIHVDLWLHGYAMLLRDTATVPVFRRGYRDAAQAAKTSSSVTTLLDDNRTRLQQRLTT